MKKPFCGKKYMWGVFWRWTHLDNAHEM